MSNARPVTIKDLKALITDLPDDGIVVIDNRSEERVLLNGEYRTSFASETRDEDFNAAHLVDGANPTFPVVLHLTSWS